MKYSLLSIFLIFNYSKADSLTELFTNPETTAESDEYIDDVYYENDQEGSGGMPFFTNRNLENNLRQDLFVNYNKKTRPVSDTTDTINLLYGLNIEGLISFDQKAEKINLNILTTLIWEDQYLQWDQDSNPEYPDYLIVSNSKIWEPDLELYNSGSQPQIFETSGTSKLYSNGLVIYNRPTSYTFSCKLALQEFPFDTQICEMTFGSWKYPKATLNLRPFRYTELYNSFMNISLGEFLNDKNITRPRRDNDDYDDYDDADSFGESYRYTDDFWWNDEYYEEIDPTLVEHLPIFLQDLRKIKNITVSEQFSHNEWNIINVSVTHEDIEYKCCPNDLWPNSVFRITLERNPNKYVISIVMAVFITFSSIVVNLLNLSQYRRTYILVFIPLTLIWLQIHTSSKVPVIQYPTKLERIIQLCFYTTITSAFESGIIYNLLLNRFNVFETLFTEKLFKKMQVINRFQLILIKKQENISIDNKYFKAYSRYLMIFDNFFRLLLTFIFIVYFAALI